MPVLLNDTNKRKPGIPASLFKVGAGMFIAAYSYSQARGAKCLSHKHEELSEEQGLGKVLITRE